MSIVPSQTPLNWAQTRLLLKTSLLVLLHQLSTGNGDLGDTGGGDGQAIDGDNEVSDGDDDGDSDDAN